MDSKRYPFAAVVLAGAAVAALALDAWFGSDKVANLWNQRFAFSLTGRFNLDLTLQHWVNDALMALFFLAIALEAKRELLVGELASFRGASLPLFAALGGMLVPALFYAAFNWGTPHASGWPIPMGTDLILAVAILVLLGKRVPRSLIVFLGMLAIADNLGAVLAIAAFYTPGLDTRALHAAAALFVLLLLFNRGGVRHPLPYAIVGVVLWYTVLLSGVHASLAGILLAAAIPARPRLTPAQLDHRIGELQDEFRADHGDAVPAGAPGNEPMPSIAHAMEQAARNAQSPLHRIERGLSPWVAFLVIPAFALVNAGIDLVEARSAESLFQPVTLGVIAGLVLGKFAGIGLASWAAVRTGLARLPEGMKWPHLLGAAWLAGIGFTMSIFIAKVALADPARVGEAKLGIFVASCVSAALGAAWLAAYARRGRERG